MSGAPSSLTDEMTVGCPTPSRCVRMGGCSPGATARDSLGPEGSALDWALAQNPKIIEGLIVLALFAVYVFCAIVRPSVACANADCEYVTTGGYTAPLLRRHMNPETLVRGWIKSEWGSGTISVLAFQFLSIYIDNPFCRELKCRILPKVLENGKNQLCTSWLWLRADFQNSDIGPLGGFHDIQLIVDRSPLIPADDNAAKGK